MGWKEIRLLCLEESRVLPTNTAENGRTRPQRAGCSGNDVDEMQEMQWADHKA